MAYIQRADYWRNRYLKKRDLIRSQQREYYQNNKDAIKSKAREKYHSMSEAEAEHSRQMQNKRRKTPSGKISRQNECRKRYAKDPIKARERWLICKYGISSDQFKALEESQGGVCAICKKPEAHAHRWNGVSRFLRVDHCHKSGKIRGLLCHNCNAGIGNLKDSIEFLQRAIEYLTGR